jgi:hypothetical protein
MIASRSGGTGPSLKKMISVPGSRAAARTNEASVRTLL